MKPASVPGKDGLRTAGNCGELRQRMFSSASASVRAAANISRVPGRNESALECAGRAGDVAQRAGAGDAVAHAHRAQRRVAALAQHTACAAKALVGLSAATLLRPCPTGAARSATGGWTSSVSTVRAARRPRTPSGCRSSRPAQTLTNHPGPRHVNAGPLLALRTARASPPRAIPRRTPLRPHRCAAKLRRARRR